VSFDSARGSGQARRHDLAPEFGLKADIGFMGSASGVITVLAPRPEGETNHEHAQHARRVKMRSSLVNLVARFVGFG
jgi:hypothetical protein